MELRECPFCWGHATSYGTRKMESGGSTHCLIHCDECSARLSAKTEAEAVAAWNRRAGRTCNVESSHVEQEIGYYSYLEVELSCGHEFTWDDGTPPDYCPNCGARVIEEES